MAVKVGTFVKQLGEFTSVDGLGFEPKAIIFWTTGTDANNTWQNVFRHGVGAWAEGPLTGQPTPAPRQHSLFTNIFHGQLYTSTTNVHASFASESPLHLSSRWVEVSDTHADGFQVRLPGDWPLNSQIHYQAIGGAGVRASWIPHDIYVTTENAQVGDIVPLRGIDFTPTATMCLGYFSSPDTPAIRNLSIGFSDENYAQWSMGDWFVQSIPGFTGSVGVQYQHPTAAIASYFTLGELVFRVEKYVQGGVDLKILNVDNDSADQNDVNGKVFVLALSGLRSSATFETMPTSNTEMQRPKPFRPEGVFFVSSGVDNYSGWGPQTGVSNERIGKSIGASDGAAHASTWNEARGLANPYDGVNTARVVSVSRNDLSFVKALKWNGSNAMALGGSFSRWFDPTEVRVGTNNANVEVTPAGTEGVATRFGMMTWGEVTKPLQATMYLTSFLQAIKMGTPVFLSATIRALATFYPQVFGNAGNIANVQFQAVSIVQASLAHQHLLTMAVNAVTDLFIQNGFGFTRPLTATMAAVSVFNPIKAGTPAPLSPVQFAAVSQLYIQYGLRLQHNLITEISSRLELETRFKTTMPTVRAATSYEIAGAVNWHGNPSAESGLVGWFTEGAGPVITQSAEESWDGAFSVKRVTTAASAFQGITARSFAGLEVTGLDTATGLARRVAGQIRLLGEAGTTLWVWQRVRYTDGTQTDGEAIEVVLTGTRQEDWKVYYPPQVALNPAKALNFVEVVAATPVAVAAMFYADGVQIEEEKGHGPTRFTIGSYGYEAGTWQGFPHISMSYRPPLPSVITGVGIGGEITVEAKMYRATWDNHWLEDISDMVIDATVTMDTSREVTWTLDANFKWAEYQRLNENEDWLAPVLTVRYPNGEVKTGQLGLYFLVPGETTRNEFDATVQVSAFDPLWLVARQAFTGPVRVLAGAERTKVVRDILNGAVLTGGAEMGPRRYSGPITNKSWKKRREWPKDTDRLTLANELLEGTGMYPLWSVASGEMKWRKRGEDRMADRYPVRVWAANLNPGETVVPFIPRVNYLKSEVVGAVNTKAKAMDAYDEILMINDDPDNKRIRVRGRVKGRGKNMRVVRGRGDRKRVRKMYAPYVDDEATAAEIAAALADELNNRTEHVDLSVLPDPSVDYCRETVLLAIWDAFHNPVAVGQFQVNSCRWGFTPTTCIQKMDLSRVDAEAEIETFIL